jgi:hypothetical protein
MNAIRQVWFRFRALFRRRNLETEMAEEMRQHVERRIQGKVSAGMSPDEARYTTQREFGGMAQVQGVYPLAATGSSSGWRFLLAGPFRTVP